MIICLSLRLILSLQLTLTILTSSGLNQTALNIQVLSWYFPQFYPFPENNQNWGEGFTDWSLVKPSPETNVFGVPVRKPGELGYYNLLDKEIREKQGKLAREYGVDGFIFYHYWLENRPVMSEVLAKRLLDGEPNIPFMMCLVNEPWQSKFYNLKTKKLGSGEMLLRMLYDEPEKLFNYLLPFFLHTDYIKIDKKPVYIIYRAPQSTAFDHTVRTLRKLALSHGLPGLHIVQCLQNFGKNSYLHKWADAGIEFSSNLLLEDLQCGSTPPLSRSRCTPNGTHHFNGLEVGRVWSTQTREGNAAVLSSRFFRSNHDVMHPSCAFNLKGHNKPVYHGGTVAWDATPRYPLKKGEPLPKYNIIPPPEVAASPDSFLKATVSRLCKALCDAQSLPGQGGTSSRPNFYALFAWNEWGEGATLEPTQLEGRAYLDALKTAKKRVLEQWPGGVCGEPCAEMRRLRSLEGCHATAGCFSKFDCWPENLEFLNNGVAVAKKRLDRKGKPVDRVKKNET